MPSVPMVDVSVAGYANDEFGSLTNIFARMVAAGRGSGAALAVYRHGEQKVDLTGGSYRADTVQLQFSVSKAVAAIAAAHAESAQVLDPDEPISEYWKEFDRPGTRAITPRMVLSHTSGLAGVGRRLSIDDLVAGRYAEELEQQDPYWEPGMTHGYHAFSFGPLLDGIFRRTLGRSVGDYFREHIGVPLGLEVWFGLPEGAEGRLAPYRRSFAATTPLIRSLPSLRQFRDEGSFVLAQDPMLANRGDVLRQEWPSMNVVCTARDMARLFAAVIGEVDNSRVLDADALRRMIARQASGIDWVLRFPIAFGTGVQLPFPQLPFTGSMSFGHEGAGGCVAFADLERDIAVAFSTDAFPACDGAGVAALALCLSIQHLCDLG